MSWYTKWFYSFVFFSLFCVLAYSETIDVDKKEDINLLLQSKLYISSYDLNRSEILKIKDFTPYKEDQFSLGFTNAYIYFTFTLENNSSKTIEKLLVETSPVLEEMYLFHAQNATYVEKKGMKHLSPSHRYISYAIPLTIPAHTKETYYVKLHSSANPIELQLFLQEEETFLDKQLSTLAFNLLFLGVIFAFMFYSFALSFYVKDKSYFFYALYLFFLWEQQMTQLGISQIYFPWWVSQLSLRVNIVNLALLSIAAILFAMSFLNTKNMPRIHKTYIVFIVLYTLEMFFLSSSDVRSLNIIVLTGLMLIVFNIFAGIYIYRQGYKQARLFVLGFGIVTLVYTVLILDSLGITTLMHHMYNALLIATALEAFILLLAFADRYLILQKEKEEAEQKKLLEAQDQAVLIEKVVTLKTKELKHALKTKELLIQEMHHRIKNNLHIILSIIHLQKSEMSHPHVLQKMTELEHRIAAISNTYNTLLGSDDFEHIFMQTYIETLINDISKSYNNKEKSITFQLMASGTLPIKHASYVGLVLNELITNAYKYAFEHNTGTISIIFQLLKEEKKHRYYELIVEDNGKGFDPEKIEKKLGLTLISTLVEEELNGEVQLQSKPHTKYTIAFNVKNSQ